MSLFHKTFITSTFRDDDLLNTSTLLPDNSRSYNVHDQRLTHVSRTYQVLIDSQAINHVKPTLEEREVTKLLQRDTTFSNDDLPSYAQSIKLISTTSTTHPVNNVPKERRCPILSTKEDRQPRNRLSLLFHISPAILPSTNVREVHLVNHKLPFTDI